MSDTIGIDRLDDYLFSAVQTDRSAATNFAPAGLDNTQEILWNSSVIEGLPLVQDVMMNTSKRMVV
jgi:hypothetical protein